MAKQQRSDLNVVFSMILCELNPKSTGLLGPDKAGLVAYIIFYKMYQFESPVITNDVIMNGAVTC